jgi:hypothetical protein
MAETIEITAVNQQRDTWYNPLIGEKLEAIEHKNVFQLTDAGLLKASELTGKELCYGIIPKQFAAIEGEVIAVNNIERFPLVQRHIKFLVEVRRFVVKEDVHKYNRHGEIVSTILRKGEVWEEMYDKPNHLIKVDNLVDIKKIQDINKSTLLLPAFECTETIPAKESAYFNERREDVRKQYIRKMKNLEKLKGEINNLEFLLDINNENEE